MNAKDLRIMELESEIVKILTALGRATMRIQELEKKNTVRDYVTGRTYVEESRPVMPPVPSSSPAHWYKRESYVTPEHSPKRAFSVRPFNLPEEDDDDENDSLPELLEIEENKVFSV